MLAPPAPVPAGFKIRRARRGDAEALSALLITLGHPEGADTATVHWVMSHPEIEVLVAVDAQDKPVGMLSMAHRPQLRTRGRTASIEELVVAPAARRKGLGRALLQHAVERARVLNANHLNITAESGDPALHDAFASSSGLKPSPARQWSLGAQDLKPGKR